MGSKNKANPMFNKENIKKLKATESVQSLAAFDFKGMKIDFEEEKSQYNNAYAGKK